MRQIAELDVTNDIPRAHHAQGSVSKAYFLFGKVYTKTQFRKVMSISKQRKEFRLAPMASDSLPGNALLAIEILHGLPQGASIRGQGRGGRARS